MTSTLNSELTNERIIEIADATRTAESRDGDYILPISFARAIEAEVRMSAPNEPVQALPELPSALCRDDTLHEVDYFTAEQMQDYARAAIASGRALSKAEIDVVVYQCRQSGNDTTYDIVNACLRAALASCRALPAKDEAKPDYLKWWTSIETDVRKSMLVWAHREPARLHALIRQAFEAGAALAASSKGEGNE